jgi:hypothetical protein
MRRPRGQRRRWAAQSSPASWAPDLDAWYSFPPTHRRDDRGRPSTRSWALWTPIFDEFDRCGVRFALEVHPTEIAFDLVHGRAASQEVRRPADARLQLRPEPSALAGARAAPLRPRLQDEDLPRPHEGRGVSLDGRAGILGSHLPFGDLRRGWNFRSLGHGDVDFEAIIRELNAAGYDGPLSVEWEDNGMDREFGAREALEFVRDINFTPSTVAFDKDMKR